MLSLLTKIASGYWHVADSQSGLHRGLRSPTLERLDLDRLYPRYGFPNDMLVHLNVVNARVRDVPSRPVYGVGERSGIKLRKVDPADLLAAREGVLLAAAREVRDPRLPPARLLLPLRPRDGPRRPRARDRADRPAHPRATSITAATGVLVALLLIFGSQFTLFAMWFDMESNKDLR